MNYDVPALLHKAKNGELMCCLATECERTTTMPTFKEVHEHMNCDDPGRKLLCSLAKEVQCTSSFLQIDGMARHVKTKHIRKSQYACPLAKEKNCTKVFTWRRDAKSHADEVHGERHPCPLAQSKGLYENVYRKIRCESTRKYEARKCAITMPFAEEQGCTETYIYKKRHYQ